MNPMGFNAPPVRPMSQINPFRGVVVPSSRPQGVQVQKDRQQRRPSQQGREQEQPSQEDAPPKPDDGKPHVDVKA
jgi:hypothetical protein